MKNAHLGTLEVSRIGLGAMTMAGTYTSEGALDNAESIRTIHRALDLGVTHIDTAEIYGPFLSEEIVGQAVKGRRDQVKIATKFGLVSHAGGGPGVIDSSAANVKAAVEGSLKRLGTDHIDLLLPAPRRPEHPDRGDRRRGRRPDRRGQGAALRPVRGLPGDHPPRTRRAAGLRACRPSTRCGPATWRPRSCRCCANSASASCPYSPLGHGLLTGQIRTVDDFADDDWRKTNPRFTGRELPPQPRASSTRSRPSAPRSAPPPRRPRSPGS